jgi:hypothetical protein
LVRGGALHVIEYCGQPIIAYNHIFRRNCVFHGRGNLNECCKQGENHAKIAGKFLAAAVAAFSA